MFWNKKDKKKPQKTAKERVPMTRAEIIAQAKSNMAAARAEIGDETLDKIKEAMLKKQQSSIEQAKVKIRSADPHEVRDHVRGLIREDK